MARKKIISDDIREQIIARVDAFNQESTRPAAPTAVTRLLQGMGKQRDNAGGLRSLFSLLY